MSVVLKALADPTRVRILNMLAAGEQCVFDLVDLLQVPQSTVSRHLGILNREGLIAGRRDSQFVHYSLAASADALIVGLLEIVRRDFASSAALVAEREASRQRFEHRRLHPCGSRN